MHFKNLSHREILVRAEADPRYQVDPLFTELVIRLREILAEAKGIATMRREQSSLIDAK